MRGPRESWRGRRRRRRSRRRAISPRACARRSRRSSPRSRPSGSGSKSRSGSSMSSRRSWWRPAAIDSHEARAFGFPAVRTLVVRVVLAAGAVALLAATTASARDLDPRDRGLLQEGTGVVVVDLSLSIEDDTSGAVRSALRRLMAADAPVGLVVFSDVPYELLPPGTPSSELKGLVRMLTPVGGAGVVNPWSDTFRAGTRISTAMQLARAMLKEDHVKHGSVLLISDLE